MDFELPAAEEYGGNRDSPGGVDKRIVLKLDPRLAPVKAAVLPLSRNEKLSPKAKELAAQLRRRWNVDFDDAGAIGRRYRRQDEIGTPFCITVDFDTLDDDAVTIRRRDDMSQERVPLAEVVDHLAAGGVHGIFVLGSSGEVPYLTNAERDLVLETALEAAAEGTR